MDIARKAPPRVLELLRRYDAKLGARWDPIARQWEITRRSPVIVHQADSDVPTGPLAVICERRELAECVLTWPHWELTSSVMERVMAADGWRMRWRGQFLQERVIDPITRQRVERARRLRAFQQDGRREMQQCLARDLGWTETVSLAGLQPPRPSKHKQKARQ